MTDDIKPELIEKAMAPAMLAWAIGCGCCAEPTPDEYDGYDEPRGAWIADLMLSAVADDLRAEAWDKGFAAGANADLGDWEHPPEEYTNPYRQEARDERNVTRKDTQSWTI